MSNTIIQASERCGDNSVHKRFFRTKEFVVRKESDTFRCRKISRRDEEEMDERGGMVN